MSVRQGAQTSNENRLPRLDNTIRQYEASENRLPLQKKVSGYSRSSVTTIHRMVKKRHINLEQIFILSLELTILMVLGGSALMVAINGMNAGPPLP
ncbi:MAG: hypothetical protein WCC17_09810 [Candidatus Nitrosopolaris sp.]|jgi:hypothetical protein